MDRDGMRWIPFHSPARSQLARPLACTSFHNGDDQGDLFPPWRSLDERGGASHETADRRTRWSPSGPRVTLRLAGSG